MQQQKSAEVTVQHREMIFFFLKLEEISEKMKSNWIMVDEVEVNQAEWCRNSIPEEEQHVQRYGDTPLIDYVREITSILVFMEHKLYEWEQFPRETKLEIFAGSEHKVSAKMIVFFPRGNGEAWKVFK